MEEDLDASMAISVPEPVVYNLENMRYLTKVLELTQKLATECPGYWISNGTLELAAADQLGPGEFAGMIRIHTDNQENVQVVFQPAQP